MVVENSTAGGGGEIQVDAAPHGRGLPIPSRIFFSMALIGSIKKNEKKSIIKRKYEIRTQNKIIVKIKLVANRFEYELRNRKQNKIIVKIKSIANRFVIRITNLA